MCKVNTRLFVAGQKTVLWTGITTVTRNTI